MHWQLVKKKVRNFLNPKGGRKDALAIFDPTPFKRTTPWPGSSGPMPTIGKVKIRNKTRNIKLYLGRVSNSKGGSLIGLGHLESKTPRQWMRFDWHRPDGKLGHHEGEYVTSSGSKWHLHTCSASN